MIVPAPARPYYRLMLLRLLLALTIALLPMPAAANCHPAPQPVAHHHGPAKHEPVKPLPTEQLCIGCVAPATARTPMVAPPLAFARADARPVDMAGESLGDTPPATPPPRSEA